MPHRIHVEVGTPAQRELVARELETVLDLAAALSPPLAVARIVVPRNFDGTVNALQGTSDYASDPQRPAVAETVHGPGGTSFVFSSALYTDLYDQETRLLAFLHEIVHAVQEQGCPPPLFAQRSRQALACNVYVLADEYLANAISYGILHATFPRHSSRYARFVRDCYAGHRDALLACRGDLRRLSDVILALPEHNDLGRFLHQWRQVFDPLARSLVCACAILDSFDDLAPEEAALEASPLLTRNAARFVDYVRGAGSLREIVYDQALPLAHAFLAENGLSFNFRGTESYADIIEPTTGLWQGRLDM